MSFCPSLSLFLYHIHNIYYWVFTINISFLGNISQLFKCICSNYILNPSFCYFFYTSFVFLLLFILLFTTFYLISFSPYLLCLFSFIRHFHFFLSSSCSSLSNSLFALFFFFPSSVSPYLCLLGIL